jgi:DNA invertase Pin-like site-specific DNA recombinase
MFQMLGVFAEFERNVIRERVIAGMTRARETGTKSGKAIGRPSLDPRTQAAIRAAYQADGASLRSVAKMFRCSAETVRRYLRD